MTWLTHIGQLGYLPNAMLPVAPCYTTRALPLVKGRPCHLVTGRRRPGEREHTVQVQRLPRLIRLKRLVLGLTPTGRRARERAAPMPKKKKKSGKKKSKKDGDAAKPARPTRCGPGFQWAPRSKLRIAVDGNGMGTACRHPAARSCFTMPMPVFIVCISTS